MDLAIVNAVVRTCDLDWPSAQAVAVRGNRIVAVGTNDEIRAQVASNGRVIDAEGRLLLPGFNDAHVHFLMGGFQLQSVDLRAARDPREFAERIGAFAATRPAGTWIKGGGWNHELWPESILPAKEWIDSITRDTPVLVERLDGHMALANSLALQLAGVTRATLDPSGGLILRDSKTGEPTGLLKDAAMKLVERLMPLPTSAEKLAAGIAATQHAASLGVTSVHDMSMDDDLGIYEQMLEHGELKTRINGMWPLPRWREWQKAEAEAGRLRRGGLKGFSDGSLGSTTALFFEEYRDAPGFFGLLAPEMFPEGAMWERIDGADRAGHNLVIHAIGDKANDLILTMLERVKQSNPPRPRRHRIEHAQHLRPTDFPRFTGAGVIASMQPYHCIDDGCWAERRLGRQRCQSAFAFRSLLDAGATLAFGSDWPVAPLSAIAGIAAAVTRSTLDGKNPDGWFAEQKITVAEAVSAYTIGSAFAEFAETQKGRLTPGMLADLVMLDRDIFQISPDEIKNARVEMTIMDGRVVYPVESSSHFK